MVGFFVFFVLLLVGGWFVVFLFCVCGVGGVVVGFLFVFLLFVLGGLLGFFMGWWFNCCVVVELFFFVVVVVLLGVVEFGCFGVGVLEGEVVGVVSFWFVDGGVRREVLDRFSLNCFIFI